MGRGQFEEVGNHRTRTVGTDNQLRAEHHRLIVAHRQQSNLVFVAPDSNHTGVGVECHVLLKGLEHDATVKLTAIHDVGVRAVTADFVAGAAGCKQCRTA